MKTVKARKPILNSMLCLVQENFSHCRDALCLGHQGQASIFHKMAADPKMMASMVPTGSIRMHHVKKDCSKFSYSQLDCGQDTATSVPAATQLQ